MFTHIRYDLSDQSHWMRSIFVVLAITMFALALGSCSDTPFTETATPGNPGSEIPGTSLSPKSTPFPPDFPTPDPERYQECMDQGGRWEVLGFSGPGCNLPTTDGGKSCRNSDECESACLAADESAVRANGYGGLTPDHQRIDELNAQGDDLPGACSPWRENFGCNVWVQNGRYAVLCAD